MLVLRSLAFQFAFYVASVVETLATLPFFFFVPRKRAMGVVRFWCRTTMWLLRVVAGTRIEVRGRENLVGGASIVASKHQSMFETLALFPLLEDPAIVMKEELGRIPVFGAYTLKAGMIHLDRGGRATALRRLAERARGALAEGREIIIFPEGTRRKPGAEPAYQSGIAMLYKQLGVPVVPVALNSGLYWPKNSFVRHSGTIVVEFLPAIPPGLPGREFLATLQARIETASDALIVEAAASKNPPPLQPEAQRVVSAGDSG